MNHQARITLLTRVALPALAGFLIANAIPRPSAAALRHLAASRQVTEERRDLPPHPLPDDPALIKLAAMSGRAGEAKKSLADALAAGAEDNELAEWLAAILTTEPAWLDTFILTVPEDRRSALIVATLELMARAGPEAAWDLLQRSPAAIQVIRADQDPIFGPTGSFLEDLMKIPEAGEHLLDPALGFSDKQIDELFSLSDDARNRANAPLIFRALQTGRWGTSVPECELSAWNFFTDEQRLQIEQTASPELIAALAPIKAPADFSLLPPEELEHYVSQGGERTATIPPDALSGLPPELREQAAGRYLRFLYPGQAAQAEEMLDRLDDFPLTPGQKQELLLQGAAHEGALLGHLDTALQLLGRVSDEKARNKATDEIFTSLALADPQSLLDYAQRMEPGPRRDQIIEKATRNLP